MIAAKIDKLSILGVRSFDNTRSETIQFHTPLTLIVGYNGSGKTTIIECLKYATTGELPPNSKTQGAFIHDPKLCGEREVLAQVKLSFKSTSAARMVVTRSLQLTAKKTTRTQKTLEGQLLMIKEGERTAISSRVAELDQIMPQYLGVSKAILDSVIFCHQDASLWPLSEPLALKKRFDEIFEAQKYTNAIDNIKKLRKTHMVELEKFKIVEQHAKDDKNKAEKSEKRSRELSDHIEALRSETMDLQTKVREAGDKALESWNQVASYERVVETLKVDRDRMEWYKKTIDDLSQDLKQRPESDEWLQSELDQYEERVLIHEGRQKQQAKRYDDVKQEIEQVRQKQRSKHIEAGKHEQRKASHEQQIRRREDLVHESARRHNIRGYDTEFDDMEINEFMEKISKLRKDQISKVERSRRETDDEIQKCQKALSSLEQQKSGFQAGKSSKRDQIATNDRNIATSQSSLNEISMDEGGKAALEANVEDMDNRLDKAKDNLKKESWGTKIEKANAQLRSLEEESESLNRELIQGTKHAGELARLEHLNKELNDRQRSLKTMTGVHGDRLRSAIGPDWQTSNIEANFSDVLNHAQRQLIDIQRQRDNVSRELEHVETKLKSSREDKKRKERELQKCANEVRDRSNAEPEEYLESLKGFQQDRDVLKSDFDGFSTHRDYFGKCIEIAKNKSACRLCSRQFDDVKGVEQFVLKLQRMISQETLEKAQKEFEDAESDLEKAKSARSSYDTWVRISDKEVPDIREEIQRLEARRESLVRQLEEQDKIVSEHEEATRDIETLSKPVTSISKYSGEISSLRKQIDDVTEKQQDAGMSRTLEAIQEQIESKGVKIRTLKSSIDKTAADRERAQRQINALESDISKAKNELNVALFQLEKKSHALSQIGDLKNLNRDLRSQVESFDESIQHLFPQISEQETRLADVKQRGTAKEQGLQQEAAGLSDSVRALYNMDQDIRTYINDGSPAKLARCQREIESCQQDIARLESEQRQITVEINTIGEELRNHQQTKRSIHDNLKYRKTLREMDAVKAEIEQLSAQNAEADQAHHRKNAEQWQREGRKLEMSLSGKMATMKEKDNQLTQLLDDWETLYKGAGLKYKESHIKVETTKAVIEDLGRYGGALDKAIMQYHSLKMEEINRIVEELWKSTYQGTDVDTILIRSDNASSGSKSSYNYHVCMIKQDAEMDMRGRCSAGQKVLASIIIRLALAECFGVNCGIIALDEPTTNLDRDNIRSLAESLHRIITVRRQQNNFQLIVITHDEEFLKSMQCGDFCDHYYRVSRNDREKSIIERQSIAEVML